ncbi:glycosyltransferase family 4 protein [Nocardioides coralli]|uniref:glycosyltransferase family 4 protein n=1 Tax=Nocardioides coralli TaxID=2872154 RepID=UPI001CA43266|nr:glycosyltransferase family 4 protein [Nocardioides coralli]QZY29806.1 glycosyltransferase family 4 protein [Nocardioides coralli]
MRVLQLHNHHASLGGAMEVLAHEARLLTGGGHEVEEFALPAAQDLGLSSVRAGAKAVWNVEAARETRRRIRRFRPDVVHVHTPFPLMSPSVFRAAAAEGVPAVTTLHSYRWVCAVGTCVRDDRICEDCVGSRLKLPGIRHGCYHDSRAATAALTLGLVVHRAVGTTHRDVTRYLALTDFMRRLMVRDGYPEDRVVVKPNSVPDPGPTVGRTGSNEVFCAARLIEIKGIRTLLEAWRLADPGLRLVIAGDGPLRGLVEEAAAADPRIEYLGWLDEEEVTARMRRALAVVVPSEWYEGQPLVILRSLAVGTPLLVSDLDNLGEDVRRHGTGWTFRTRDAASLADQLRALSARPERAEALRGRARETYERHFSPGVDLQRLEAVYAEVVAPRAAEGAHA